MPNHVYHHFAMSNLTDKQKQILKKIENNHNGMCGYYIPMPKDIRDTSSPTRLVSESEYELIMSENKRALRKNKNAYISKPITKAMQDRLIQIYGHDNWYDWAYERWGTKWGCYDNEIDGETLRCTTAWSPMLPEIVELFALDFPDFEWFWEEEQGYGGTIIYKDGMVEYEDSFDMIEWEDMGSGEIDGESFELCYTRGRPASYNTEVVHPGFYLSYCTDEYLGEQLPFEYYDALSDDDKKKILKFINK